MSDYFGFNTTQINTLRALGFDNQAITDLEDAVTAIQAVNTAQATSITNLNAWATALATKLNADAGVTDTNYDTNPQA
jgi:hypothetical protein